MKKNKFLIVISILLLIIIIILLIIRKPSKENEIVEELSLGDIYEEINLASNQSFNQIVDYDIALYLPLNVEKIGNLLFAIDVDDQEEYFVIGKNLNRDNRAQLEDIYSRSNEEENIIFYSDEKYIYLIKSEEYAYMIDGIIKSFIINNENKG